MKKAYVVVHNKWGTVERLEPVSVTTLQRLQEGREFKARVQEEMKICSAGGAS